VGTRSLGRNEAVLYRWVYCNNLGDEGEDHVRSASGDNYQRMVALKNKYDPTIVFRLNQNVRPTP
jgi:Berberine and berberine like